MTVTSESDHQREQKLKVLIVYIYGCKSTTTCVPTLHLRYYQIIHGFMFPELAERRQSCQDDSRRMVSSDLRDHLPLLLHLRCQLHAGIAVTVPATRCLLFIV